MCAWAPLRVVSQAKTAPEVCCSRSWERQWVGLATRSSRGCSWMQLGIDLRMSNHFTAAPVLGYWQLFQKDEPLYSTDARFVWFGVVLGWQPGTTQRVVEEQQITHHRWVEHKRERAPAPAPAPEQPPPDPSPELLTLIEGSLPAQKNELLAPVLFGYDSDVLEPQGVAMLHEVARELERKPQLKRVEISGYADARGDQAYNFALSERRARAVLEWLVAHGVERTRLTIAAQGASDLVEQGADEPAHQQNRRVVFRVLEEDKP
jgi:outer membrane protein OmpA-like peptidoglycan-associated protein